jgi:hypothetical protein
MHMLLVTRNTMDIIINGSSLLKKKNREPPYVHVQKMMKATATVHIRTITGSCICSENDTWLHVQKMKGTVPVTTCSENDGRLNVEKMTGSHKFRK